MAFFKRSTPAELAPTITFRDVRIDPVVAVRPDSATTPWSQLRPWLRPVETVAFSPVAEHLMWRGVGDYLVEMVALDLPDSMQIVNKTTTSGWDGSPAEWFDTARHNLAAQPLDAHFTELDGNIVTPVHVDGPDSYQAAWALTHESISRALQVPGATITPGRTVVVAHDRDHLYVMSSNDERLIEGVLDTAWQRVMGSDDEHPVSPAPYLVDGGRLVAWTGNRPGTLAAKAVRALKLVQYRAHAAQYDWLVADGYARLTELSTSRGGTVMVGGRPSASLQPDDPTHLIVTATIVQNGDDDDLYLAHSDEVLLVALGGGGPAVPRSAFDAICAPILSTDTSLPLPFTRVHGWPDAAMWQQLRQYGRDPFGSSGAN